MLQPFHEAQHGLNTHEGRDLHAVMHLAIRDMVEHGTSTGLSCKYRRYQHALAPIITANAFGPLPDTRFGQRRRAVDSILVSLPLLRAIEESDCFERENNTAPAQ